MNRQDVENYRVRNAEDFCKLVEELDYKDHGNHFPQLQCNNGAHVSSLMNFLDDNPAALEMLVGFIATSPVLVSQDEEEEDDVLDLDEDDVEDCPPTLPESHARPNLSCVSST